MPDKGRSGSGAGLAGGKDRNPGGFGPLPVLAVGVRESGTVLVDGGQQTEHSYEITVSVARTGNETETRSYLPGWFRCCCGACRWWTPPGSGGGSIP
ncbi:MAG: hypothetical protein HFF84_03015 [Oscillibacter sp.]|nr:hypothetical protein [Oscillibacter sp.]